MQWCRVQLREGDRPVAARRQPEPSYPSSACPSTASARTVDDRRRFTVAVTGAGRPSAAGEWEDPAAESG